MTLVLEFPRESSRNRVLGALASVTLCAGIAVSSAVGTCAILDYLQLVHTDIGAFIVDQMQNGERRFNPNGDIHGDWGNLIFSALAAPLMIGMYGAALLSSLRSD